MMSYLPLHLPGTWVDERKESIRMIGEQYVASERTGIEIPFQDSYRQKNPE